MSDTNVVVKKNDIYNIYKHINKNVLPMSRNFVRLSLVKSLLRIEIHKYLNKLNIIMQLCS